MFEALGHRLSENGFIMDTESMYKYFDLQGKKKETLNKYNVAHYVMQNVHNQRRVEQMY
jgi:hypothetical protein